MNLELNQIRLTLSSIVLIASAACGGPADLGIDRSRSFIGTPGCPDCTDPCELEDTATALKIFGQPVDVDPPISAVKVRLWSATELCERSADPSLVTVLPSEDTWTTTDTTCGIASPTDAELEIASGGGTTILTCRIQ